VAQASMKHINFTLETGRKMSNKMVLFSVHITTPEGNMVVDVEAKNQQEATTKVRKECVGFIPIIRKVKVNRS